MAGDVGDAPSLGDDWLHCLPGDRPFGGSRSGEGSNRDDGRTSAALGDSGATRGVTPEDRATGRSRSRCTPSSGRPTGYRRELMVGIPAGHRGGASRGRAVNRQRGGRVIAPVAGATLLFLSVLGTLVAPAVAASSAASVTVTMQSPASQPSGSAFTYSVEVACGLSAGVPCGPGSTLTIPLAGSTEPPMDTWTYSATSAVPGLISSPRRSGDAFARVAGSGDAQPAGALTPQPDANGDGGRAAGRAPVRRRVRRRLQRIGHTVGDATKPLHGERHDLGGDADADRRRAREHHRRGSSASDGHGEPEAVTVRVRLPGDGLGAHRHLPPDPDLRPERGARRRVVDLRNPRGPPPCGGHVPVGHQRRRLRPERRHGHLVLPVARRTTLELCRRCGWRHDRLGSRSGSRAVPPRRRPTRRR